MTKIFSVFAESKIKTITLKEKRKRDLEKYQY